MCLKSAKIRFAIYMVDGAFDFVFYRSMGICLCFYPKPISIKWSFVHMYGNKQSIWKWPGHVKASWSCVQLTLINSTLMD